MNERTIDFLIKLNTSFYKNNASSFSNTRRAPWQGWTCKKEFIEDRFLNLKELKIIDFAAGNYRFEQYVSSILINTKVSVKGVDNCEFNNQFNLEDYPNLYIDSVNLDIISSLISNETISFNKSYELVVSFGFFHHIPSQNLRRKMFEVLVNNCRVGGYIWVSFWNFEVSKNKNDLFLEKNPNVDLEDSDYILGWKNQEDQFRYCHCFNEKETVELISLFKNVEIVKTYKSDGKSGQDNIYYILKKHN